MVERLAWVLNPARLPCRLRHVLADPALLPPRILPPLLWWLEALPELVLQGPRVAEAVRLAPHVADHGVEGR
eukprot:5309773-Heterocapsa_arctica.AAC.1